MTNWRSRLPEAILEQVDAAVTGARAGDPAGKASLVSMLKSSPKKTLLCVAAALRFEELGHPDIALDMWRSATRFDPRDPDLWRALAERTTGAEARGHRDRARRVAKATSWWKSAKQAYDAERYADALRALRKACRLVPEDKQARWDLLLRLIDAGQLDEAIDRALAIRKDDPSHPHAVDAGRVAAQICWLRGDDDRARELFALYDEESSQAYGFSMLKSHELVAARVRPIEEVASAMHWVARPAPIDVPSPVYHPPFSPPQRTHTVESPPLFVAELRDAEVVEHTGVVMQDDVLVLYDEGMAPDKRQDNMHNYLGWVRGDAAPEAMLSRPFAGAYRVDAAILAGGRAQHNYFHFLLEHLPRLLFAEDLPETRGLPAMVRFHMPSTCVQALEMVLGERRVIPMRPGARYRVERLFVPSMGGLIPDDQRFPIERLMIHPEAVRRVREAFLTRLPPDPSRGGRKIFIPRREGAMRSCSNQSEIQALCEARGFEVVDPAALDFAQQVDLFAHAETVVTTVGAAQTNATFMPEGSRMLCLWGESVPPHYFAGLARVVGMDMTFVRGDQILGSHADPLHRDFRVDPRRFLEALERPAQHDVLEARAS